MAKAKQYNFYVNPEEEADLKEFLDSFPKMIRSNWIKSAIQYCRQAGILSVGSISPPPQPNTLPNSVSPQPTPFLIPSGDIELDEDDL